MAVDEKWYFTKEQLLQSPSRKSGYDVDKELSCRQQAANFIQDMGQRLQVSQLCINTAIVYMHRFYVFHSFAAFHRNGIAAAALFLAAKVEEQPRKLEHVIRVSHMCLHRENPNLDTKSELYLEQAQDLVFNENVLLQTLGFDVAIDHPHTYVVRCCHLVRASKDLAQTSYFMASNSLHLTTMCLQYKPTVVACFCIHLACKWSNWEIPRSNEGKDWFWYIDKTVTIDLLEQLTAEFIAVLDKCPTKLKRKMMSMNQNNAPGFTHQQHGPHDGLQFEEPRKLPSGEGMKPPEGLFPVQKSASQASSDKPVTLNPATVSSLHAHHQKIDYREYREKKERERMEREKQQHIQQQRDTHNTSSGNHHHHSKSNAIPNKPHTIMQSRSSNSSISHKSYQQPPHGVQQNMHFQNVKESRDSVLGKDSNYLKQHPPHAERDISKDNITFHGQYSQNSNAHQNFPHKSESSYSGNYLHREGNRGSHSVQSSGNSNVSQTHSSQNQNAIGNNSNNNQREYIMTNQRDVVNSKDSESQLQSQGKDAMSSSIRDIINQSVSQREIHSMTSDRKEHTRDKSRLNFVHGSTTSNFRHESIKSGRDQIASFHDSTDRKMDDFASKLKERPNKKEIEDSVIDTLKMDPTHIKTEKFDETDIGDENNTWTPSNVRNEKISMPVITKTEPNSNKNESSIDSNKVDYYSSNSDSGLSGKLQLGHSMKMFDSKYKSLHYHSASKSSEPSQIKIEKPSVQCSSDLLKKINERNVDKARKIQEHERLPLNAEGSSNLGDISKHHKFNKEINDKNQMIVTGQHTDQRLKEKLSPSKFQRVKTVPRPPGLNYLKSDSGHFSLDANPISNIESEKIEVTNHTLTSNKSLGLDESNKISANLSSFPKQKNHEFGAPGNLSNTLQDSSLMKTNKTSSIFSPDSKIPPQNILSSLEKESKKSSSVSQRSNHSSNKTSPNQTTGNSKKTASVVGTLPPSNTSTTGSLFSPPLPKNIPSAQPRQRTSSSGSEPELMLIVKKLEETPGYENIIREKKIALTPTNEILGNFEKEKEKRIMVAGDKVKNSDQLLFGFDIKTSGKESKTGDSKSNVVKSDVIAPTNTSKTMVNVKFPNEIRSDLGAVIYPTNPKSIPSSKSTQGFSISETKHSFNNSISTVNLLGVEKMVDTSISPSKQTTQFNAATVKVIPGSNINFNSIRSTTSHKFSSSPLISTLDQSDKVIVDQNLSKNNSVMLSQEIDVDGLGYVDKKKSEKKKKKEKHKHKEKEKDKDKSERKKEKKKHKEKDREKSKEKSKEKEKHKEKEIDVVSSEIPIKITIPKDKISGSLKFKISKDCLKKEETDSLKSNASGELKIKISKDVINSIGTYKDESKGDTKKRERSPKSTGDLPYPKSIKTSEKKSSSSSLKPNGTEGPSRNSSSLRYSVSENGSCFDISGLYDFPFDFEESGQGIIKTPDYDFEALNASKFWEDVNTSFETKEIEECDKNSHNELELTKDEAEYVATKEPNIKATTPNPSDSCNPCVSCGDIATFSTSKDSLTVRCSLESSDFKDQKSSVKQSPSVSCPLPDNSPEERVLFRNKTEPLNYNTINKPYSSSENYSYAKRDGVLPYSKNLDLKKDQIISLENCDILKNYKTILDSHSRRCETDLKKHRVSPVSPENTASNSLSNNDNNNNTNSLIDNESGSSSCKITPSKSTKNNFDTENPNYYNKYFKKSEGARTFTAEYKRTLKGRQDEKIKFDDRQKFYENRRFRNDFNERDRLREDRRNYREYRDYTKDSSQYYYDRKDDRRFDHTDYSTNQFFNASKPESNAQNMHYEMNNNGTQEIYQKSVTFPQIRDPPVPTNPDMSVQYQYGYFNNFVYSNSYRFYGNMPFVNMSLIHQQPIPPGTGDSVPFAEPPPLPLEPPPVLPPPPETPPPPPK